MNQILINKNVIYARGGIKTVMAMTIALFDLARLAYLNKLLVGAKPLMPNKN
ncbi:MAG: hypothetical protein ACTS78_03615 [Arsenophonus sp. NC-WZS1-MAG3]